MELERIAAPVVIEHAVELRQNHREDLIRRKRERRRERESRIRPRVSARRVLDVFEKWYHLEGRDSDANDYAGQRQPKARPPILRAGSRRIPEREVQRPEAERDQQD